MRALAPIAGKITLGYADPATAELFDDQSKPTAAEKILLAKWTTRVAIAILSG